MTIPMGKRCWPLAEGFSLVELMISLVAGLIVTGAALAFALASMRSNADFVGATQLTQELRNSMDLITRELRRAGYDEFSMRYVNRPATVTVTSPFSTIFVANAGTSASCILYAYDRAAPGAGGGVIDVANGEIRGMRRVVRTVNGVDTGVIELFESNAVNTDPDCLVASASAYTTYPAGCQNGWCALSDPRRVNITQFQIDDGGLDQTVTGGDFIRVRDFTITLTGQTLTVNASDIASTRSERTTVRVRSDCVKPNLANCVVVPDA